MRALREFVAADHVVPDKHRHDDRYEPENRHEDAKETASTDATCSPWQQGGEAHNSERRHAGERDQESGAPVTGHHDDQPHA